MKVNTKALTYIVFLVSIFKYELFPVLALLLICSSLIIKFEYGINKQFLNIFIFLFYAVKYFSGISIEFTNIWYKLNQKNYITDERFIDFQQFLVPLRCRYEDNLINGYNIFGSELFLDCNNYSGTYGPLTELISINFDIWNATIVFTGICYLSITAFYFFTTKKYDKSQSTYIAFLFISPPINFLTQRMNLDILLFIFMYIAINYYKKYPNISKLILILLALLKYYSIFIFFGIIFYELIVYEKRSRVNNLFNNLIFLSGFIFFILRSRAQSNLNLPVIPFRPDRTFGILSDAYSFQNSFEVSWVYYYFAFFVFLCVLIFKFYKKNTFKTSEIKFEESLVIFWFLLTSLFANYDYRLGLMILLFHLIISTKNNLLFFSYNVFLFSSPGLLYSYGEKFNLVQDYYFVYIDLSFYFLLACLTLEYIKYIKANQTIY